MAKLIYKNKQKKVELKTKRFQSNFPKIWGTKEDYMFHWELQRESDQNDMQKTETEIVEGQRWCKYNCFYWNLNQCIDIGYYGKSSVPQKIYQW